MITAPAKRYSVNCNYIYRGPAKLLDNLYNVLLHDEQERYSNLRISAPQLGTWRVASVIPNGTGVSLYDDVTMSHPAYTETMTTRKK